MPTYTTADLRNVLLAGHGGSGKTSLADGLLFASGTVKHKGSTADGTSFSDFEKEEKEHKHSIYSSLLHADHQGKRINLIDAPGSPDLIGAAIACFAAVETVAIVIAATSGIEVVTRRIWDAAKAQNLPRAIIVNKIDGRRFISSRWLKNPLHLWLGMPADQSSSCRRKESRRMSSRHRGRKRFRHRQTMPCGPARFGSSRWMKT